MSLEETSAVVIDLGSGIIKAGLAGNVEPTVFLPSIVGRPLYESLLIGKGQKNAYVGDEARAHRDNLTISYPIKRGIISSFDDFEDICKFIYRHEMRIIPEEHPLLLTETLKNPSSTREKLTEIMFESFRVPSLYLAAQPVLSLFASKRTSGIILSCGHDVTQAVSVYEGYAIPRTIQRLDFAGRDLTKRLASLTKDRLVTSDDEILQAIKEKLCYVNVDSKREKAKVATLESTFTLPDGQIIDLGDERFMCPEQLFSSSDESLQKLVLRTIESSDVVIRENLLQNIVLAGGTTLLPGFGCRLRKEIEGLLPSSISIKPIEPTERKLSAWIGGSIFASLSSLSRVSINKKEYEEFGSNIVNQKCF